MEYRAEYIDWCWLGRHAGEVLPGAFPAGYFVVTCDSAGVPLSVLSGPWSEPETAWERMDDCIRYFGSMGSVFRPLNPPAQMDFAF